MEIRDKRKTALNILFLKYLLLFCIFVIAFSGVILILFNQALNTGYILPANYTEKEIERISETLSNSEKFDESIIPHTASYLLLDANNKKLEGNMNEKKENEVIGSLASGEILHENKYFKITRPDGTILVISYDVKAHFADSKLHNILPNLEIIILGLPVILTIILALYLAYSFSRRLKMELAPLVEATEYIRDGELDFKVEESNVKEINDVLVSVDNLKTNLASSLKEQWSLEHSKRQQVSSIAHDIRTPLTIIKGNSELLLESELSNYEMELLEYIKSSTEKIEDYVELLLETGRSNDNQSTHSEFDLDEFIAEVEHVAEGLCKTKNLSFKIIKSNIPKTIIGEKQQIFRALSNIIDNAVEHSTEKEYVSLEIRAEQDYLEFIVKDNGAGFSKEALKYAKDEFYTGNTERSGKHGLGLYLAEKVAINHGGGIIIENHEDGASVTLKIKNL